MRVALFSQDPVIGEALACLLSRSGGFEVVALLAGTELGGQGILAQAPNVLIFTEDFDSPSNRTEIRKLRTATGIPTMLLHARRNSVAEADSGFDAVQSRWAGVGAMCQAIRNMGSGERAAAPARPVPTAEAQTVIAEVSLDSLSVRERETLDFLVKGMENAEIAAKMSISEPTVKLYVSRLLRIFNCKNRVQLVLKAMGREQDVESNPRSRSRTK